MYFTVSPKMLDKVTALEYDAVSERLFNSPIPSTKPMTSTNK